MNTSSHNSETQNALPLTTNKDIKAIAKRLQRMTKAGDQALLHGIFWDDLDTLLNLILKEQENAITN